MQINNINSCSINRYNSINANKQNPSFGIRMPEILSGGIARANKTQAGSSQAGSQAASLTKAIKNLFYLGPKIEIDPKNIIKINPKTAWWVIAGESNQECKYILEAGRSFLGTLTINGKNMTAKEKGIFQNQQLIKGLMYELADYSEILKQLGVKFDIIVNLAETEKSAQPTLINRVKSLAEKLLKRQNNGLDEAAGNNPTVTFLNPHGRVRKEKSIFGAPIPGQATVHSLEDFTKERTLEVMIIPKRTLMGQIRSFFNFQDDCYIGEMQRSYRANASEDDIINIFFENLISALDDLRFRL